MCMYCMYWHTCVYMLLHLQVLKSIHMCMYCMYWHTCVYMCIHVYICRPHTDHIYSFMCWCPQQAWNIPGGGAATSGPHSGQPWAAVLPLYPAIRDPFPHPFWRTRARCTRRGGAKAAPLHSPWAIQSQWALNDPVLSPVRADLGRWCCA